MYSLSRLALFSKPCIPRAAQAELSARKEELDERERQLGLEREKVLALRREVRRAALRCAEAPSTSERSQTSSHQRAATRSAPSVYSVRMALQFV